LISIANKLKQPILQYSKTSLYRNHRKNQTFVYVSLHVFLLDDHGFHIHVEPASDHVAAGLAAAAAAAAAVDDDAGMTLQLVVDRDGSDSTFHRRRL